MAVSSLIFRSIACESSLKSVLCSNNSFPFDSSKLIAKFTCPKSLLLMYLSGMNFGTFFISLSRIILINFDYLSIFFMDSG